MNVAQKFATNMSGLLQQRPQAIAVAVSGGGDSMALSLLLRDYCATENITLLALTVDHGLREGSADEAETVAARMKKLGISHRILTWTGDKPATHIQERAREARYVLLREACVAEHIGVLALAHNLEDRIETFWMRLAHGSGLDGLSGMASCREEDGLLFLRPLLDISRDELRDLCRDNSIEWVEDPSNENEKFLRVRLRAFEDMLAAEGLTPQRLTKTLDKLQDARAALEFLTRQAKEACVTQEEGVVVLLRDPWAAYPVEIRRRVLAQAILTVQPSDYAPGYDALNRLAEAMLLPEFTGATLGGCILEGLRQGRIRLRPEPESA